MEVKRKLELLHMGQLFSAVSYVVVFVCEVEVILMYG